MHKKSGNPSEYKTLSELEKVSIDNCPFTLPNLPKLDWQILRMRYKRKDPLSIC